MPVVQDLDFKETSLLYVYILRIRSWRAGAIQTHDILYCRRWGKTTFDYLKTFLETEQASRLGLTYCSGYLLADRIMKV